jgi:hypothetical protein
MRLWATEGWEVAMEAHAVEEFEIVRRLGFDVVTLGLNEPANAVAPIEIDEWTFQRGESVQRYHPESGVVENMSSQNAPLDVQERRFREDMEIEYSEHAICPDRLYVFRRIKEMMNKECADLAIYSSLYVIPVAALPVFALEWFSTEPDLLCRYYQKQTQQVIDVGRTLAAEGAHILGLGGDFAGDTGSVISPKAYREQVVPHVRRQSDALHEEGVWTTNTTDGVLWSVLDDFLDGAGVDGYGEIDVAAGMSLERLKKERGDTCTFLGNLDIRNVLCSGTEEDARQEMIRCIEEGLGDGGHIIMTSNCVHEDVRPELYRAAIDAYRDYFGLEHSNWG